MSNIPDELKIQLEMKDRLNYPAILAHSLTVLENAYSSKDFDLNAVQNLIWGFYKAIPSSWYDKKFTEELKHVFKEIEIDNRPKFGAIRVSAELSLKMGIEPIKKVTIVDYHELRHICINLLDRKNMLVNRKKIEMMTGRNLEEGETPLAEFHDMTLSEIEELDTLDEIADKDLEDTVSEDN